MSYRNKFGITEIKLSKLNNLEISWDSDHYIHKKSDRVVILMHTPNMRNVNDRYHIRFTRAEVKKLYRWLELFLKDTK